MRQTKIVHGVDIDRINQFLNKEVEDKKLKDREDIDEIKNKDEEE
jgi:hypothetical protein